MAGTVAKIIGTVHDEIILEVPEGAAREVAVIHKETMILAGKAYLGKVSVEVGVTTGETWADKQSAADYRHLDKPGRPVGGVVERSWRGRFREQ